MQPPCESTVTASLGPWRDAHRLHNVICFSPDVFRGTVEHAKMAFLPTQNMMLLRAHMLNLFSNVFGGKVEKKRFLVLEAWSKMHMIIHISFWHLRIYILNWLQTTHVCNSWIPWYRDCHSTSSRARGTAWYICF